MKTKKTPYKNIIPDSARIFDDCALTDYLTVDALWQFFTQDTLDYYITNLTKYRSANFRVYTCREELQDIVHNCILVISDQINRGKSPIIKKKFRHYFGAITYQKLREWLTKQSHFNYDSYVDEPIEMLTYQESLEIENKEVTTVNAILDSIKELTAQESSIFWSYFMTGNKPNVVAREHNLTNQQCLKIRNQIKEKIIKLLSDKNVSY